MWTWERSRQLPVGEAQIETGAVTLGGDPAGVLVGGERRWLSVYSPGGYCWQPEPGDRVLVLKAGSEGETPCVLGRVQDGESLAPGEVCLSGGSCRVKLGQNALELSGSVEINGQPLEAYIEAVVSAALSGAGGG